jgi:secondary thiamine-phosphate synthase enzyme
VSFARNPAVANAYNVEITAAMKMHTSLYLDTDTKINVIDITDKARSFVESLRCAEGALVIHINGSTASVSTIEYEPGLIKDITEALVKLFPPTDDYHHHLTWNDGNGYSHVMATVMKPSITIPIIEGNLALGTWQQIIVLDFDNKPRRRQVILQCLPVANAE